MPRIISTMCMMSFLVVECAGRIVQEVLAQQSENKRQPPRKSDDRMSASIQLSRQIKAYRLHPASMKTEK